MQQEPWLHEDSIQWTDSDLSCGYYADYKPFMFVDGEGVRCSLYVSGCRFYCPGCFNQAAQSFRYGKPYTQEVEMRILDDLSHDYVQGLTLLGGEPFLNTRICLPLVQRVRQVFGQTKDIWVWTGYTFEQLMQGSLDKQQLLQVIDVLVDGPFLQEERDLGLQFRGSKNQRILDVPKSLKTQCAQSWEKFKPDHTAKAQSLTHRTEE